MYRTGQRMFDGCRCGDRPADVFYAFRHDGNGLGHNIVNAHWEVKYLHYSEFGTHVMHHRLLVK